MNNPADDILNRIRQENERRLSVGNELAKAIGARIEAEHLLEETKDTEKKALADAKKAGWTEAELNRITGKPAKRRARRAPSNSADFVHHEEPQTVDVEALDD